MGPAVFVLAILGCGEADAPCRQVSVENAIYASKASCDQATVAAVEKHQDIPYPVVVAECRRADAKVARQLVPTDVLLPEPEKAAVGRSARRDIEMTALRR